MIVRNDKTYVGNSEFPNSNFTNEPEGTYTIIDESTEDGFILARRIVRFFPYYELVVQNGRVIEVTKVTPPVDPVAERAANIAALRAEYLPKLQDARNDWIDAYLSDAEPTVIQAKKVAFKALRQEYLTKLSNI